MSVCKCEQRDLEGALERSMAFIEDVRSFKESGRYIMYSIMLMYVLMIVLGFLAEFLIWIKRK
jgi:hypothetical protein